MNTTIWSNYSNNELFVTPWLLLPSVPCSFSCCCCQFCHAASPAAAAKSVLLLLLLLLPSLLCCFSCCWQVSPVLLLSSLSPSGFSHLRHSIWEDTVLHGGQITKSFMIDSQGSRGRVGFSTTRKELASWIILLTFQFSNSNHLPLEAFPYYRKIGT